MNSLALSMSAPALRNAEIDAYRRDGFLAIHHALFAPAALARLDAILEDCLARAGNGRGSADLNIPHTADGRLFEMLADERLLDLVGALIGPNIAIWTTQFFCKEALAGPSVGWHADAHYWKRFLAPIDVVSVWLALDDVSSANGCLQVVPGSHRAGPFRYARRRSDQSAFFPSCVPDDRIDFSTVVNVELRRGEAVLFDGHLLHASGPNTGARRRFAYTMRYIPTYCRFEAVDLNPARRWARRTLGAARRMVTGRDIYRHCVYLARGMDVAGNRYNERPPGAS